MNRQVPVYFWEEPVFSDEPDPRLAVVRGDDGVTVLTPTLHHGLSAPAVISTLRTLLDDWLDRQKITRFMAWYYTPMALAYASHLVAEVVIYDCMDELSAFQGAPPELIEREQQLFELADVVFAGGASLYESKRSQHRNVYLFPSSIDGKHFAAARKPLTDPVDQAAVPHPRIGFFGVLDERLDRELLRAAAAMRPEWHFVLVGPVVKIEPSDLPSAPNIHYLGGKSYTELPAYLANWNVAMLPFARNASTKFISPTKTPEYLSAGKPVVSTPIRDVVTPYGDGGLVRIADTPEAFVEALEASLQPQSAEWLGTVDEYLKSTSWDKTFQEMLAAIKAVSPDRSVPASAGLATEKRSGSHV